MAAIVPMNPNAKITDVGVEATNRDEFFAKNGERLNKIARHMTGKSKMITPEEIMTELTNARTKQEQQYLQDREKCLKDTERRMHVAAKCNYTCVELVCGYGGVREREWAAKQIESAGFCVEEFNNPNAYYKESQRSWRIYLDPNSKDPSKPLPNSTLQRISPPR